MLVAPSPKDHSVDVILPVERLVNCTFRGAVPLVTFCVNAAIGRGIVGVFDGTGVGA